MSNDRTQNGPIEVLNELRKTQKQDDPSHTDQEKQSRLNKYIAQSKQEKSKKHEEEESKQQSHFIDNNLTSINPFLVKRWSEKDRPSNEHGDIEDLAKSLENVGQQVPCIVRPINEEHFQYELIVGECRWEASKLANLQLMVIVKNVDDYMASLIQAVENEKRTDLSEYAKGMSYARKIEKGLLSQRDLTEILGISRQQVSRLLSFNKIPKEISEAIGDMRQVSSRTAEEICRLASKGDEYKEILMKLAPKMRNGKCGHKSINKEIEKFINAQNKSDSNQKVYSNDGRHLFTWRLDNNTTPSIHFPKDIVKLIDDGVIEFDDLTKEIKQCLSNKLSNIK